VQIKPSSGSDPNNRIRRFLPFTGPEAGLVRCRGPVLLKQKSESDPVPVRVFGTGTRQPVPGLVSSLVGFPHSPAPRSRAASSSSVSLSRALSLSYLSVEFCFGGNSRNCSRIATTFLLQIAINGSSSSTTTTTTNSSLLIPK
jgi:hypothetical protein